MDAYFGFENALQAVLTQAWHQQHQQFLLRADGPGANPHCFPAEWQHQLVTAAESWPEQQQHQQQQQFLLMPGPASQSMAGAELHPQHYPRQQLRQQNDEEEVSAKLRQLPPSLRRRASAQTATGLLKAWMRSHADNPYPSKREKAALASLTNMSFAQISTWFANARRRLKKDSNPTGSIGSSSVPASAMASDAATRGDVASATSAHSRPRIWSLVETALSARDETASTHTEPARTARTPPETCCWQLCQRYLTGLPTR